MQLCYWLSADGSDLLVADWTSAAESEHPWRYAVLVKIVVIAGCETAPGPRCCKFGEADAAVHCKNLFLSLKCSLPRRQTQQQ